MFVYFRFLKLEISLGPDGKIYFEQGVATNSGVVGLDNVYPYV